MIICLINTNSYKIWGLFQILARRKRPEKVVIYSKMLYCTVYSYFWSVSLEKNNSFLYLRYNLCSFCLQMSYLNAFLCVKHFELPSCWNMNKLAFTWMVCSQCYLLDRGSDGPAMKVSSECEHHANNLFKPLSQSQPSTIRLNGTELFESHADDQGVHYILLISCYTSNE